MGSLVYEITYSNLGPI